MARRIAVLFRALHVVVKKQSFGVGVEQRRLATPTVLFREGVRLPHDVGQADGGLYPELLLQLRQGNGDKDAHFGKKPSSEDFSRRVLVKILLSQNCPS